MLIYVVISCVLLYAEGRPNDQRLRRDDGVAGVVNAPCQNTYSVNFKKSETTAHEKSKVPSVKDKIEDKKDKTNGKTEKKNVTAEGNEFMSGEGGTAAVKNKDTAIKKSSTVRTKKVHKHALGVQRKEIPVAEAPKLSKEKAKKRTSDDDKATGADATIADLSGAGSGETDTDNMFSGDSRSLVESGDNDGDEEGDDDDEASSSHQRQNLQLHGDPEMVDLAPKETAEQPDLDDFPDSQDKASYAKKAPPKDMKETDKKNMDDEAELDDIKIEELLNPKQEKKKKKMPASKGKAVEKMKEGKISFVLQQNFNVLYEKLDSPSYQMLSGNIKKDIEKMIPGTAVSDMSFSEVSVEGNPRQSGKTKANFNISAPSNDWMKDLLKLVDSGDIDGLRVIKGSLEIEEE